MKTCPCPYHSGRRDLTIEVPLLLPVLGVAGTEKTLFPYHPGGGDLAVEVPLFLPARQVLGVAGPLTALHFHEGANELRAEGGLHEDTLLQHLECFAQVLRHPLECARVRLGQKVHLLFIRRSWICGKNARCCNVFKTNTSLPRH